MSPELPSPKTATDPTQARRLPPVCRPPVAANPTPIRPEVNPTAAILSATYSRFSLRALLVCGMIAATILVAVVSTAIDFRDHDQPNPASVLIALNPQSANAPVATEPVESVKDNAAEWGTTKSSNAPVALPAQNVPQPVVAKSDAEPLSIGTRRGVDPLPKPAIDATSVVEIPKIATKPDSVFIESPFAEPKSGPARADVPVETKPPTEVSPGDEKTPPDVTSFYGIGSQGKRFCFVVDNSGSMSGYKIRHALEQLTSAIDKLNENESFYIVFFSDGAYPMFWPTMERDMLRATPENKIRVAEWLKNVGLGPATRGLKAMRIAFDLKPDTIYMLGDGDFGDYTIAETIRRKSPAITIHTIGLDIARNSSAERGFRLIAETFKGTYLNIPLE